MSIITTLLILLIAAATSSSLASNSSIESKAEEDSVAQSSLVIDKSSGKPNNKDWSFEEFENTMEVRLYVCLELAECLWRFHVHILCTYLISKLPHPCLLFTICNSNIFSCSSILTFISYHITSYHIA